MLCIFSTLRMEPNFSHAQNVSLISFHPTSPITPFSLINSGECGTSTMSHRTTKPKKTRIPLPRINTTRKAAMRSSSKNPMMRLTNGVIDCQPNLLAT